MNTLPNEVIHLIIEQAQQTQGLPFLELWKLRCNTLCSLARVERRWTASAHHWLYLDVWLTSSREASRLLGSRRFRPEVMHSLRTDDVGPAEVIALTEKATFLNSLHITGVASYYHLEPLLARPSLAKLKSLYLDCRLVPGANYSKIYPFALKNLILYGSWLRPDDMYSRPILPLDTSALVSVILTPPEGPDSDSDIVNGRQVLPSLFARPAPRLRIVQNVISTDLERPWFIKALQTWSSLDRLHIIIAEAGDNVVHSLLRSLRSIPSSSLPLLSALDLSFEEQVIPFLLLSPLLTMPFAKGLRLLDLHGPSADEHPIVSKAEEEGANELRKVGRGRRIEVWVEERSGQPLEDEDEDEDEHA